MNDLSGLADKCVLLTGGTGLIGGELLRQFVSLGNYGPRRIYCLSRSGSKAVAKDRLLKRLEMTDTAKRHYAKIDPILGDMRRPGLAVSPLDARRLEEEVDIVVHCAAITSFNRPSACNEVNVLGLQYLLESVATFKKSILFAFFGSAAACGSRTDSCLSEADYPTSTSRHYVHYTRTKAAAEGLIRGQRLVPDWLILRPSIVLPDNVLQAQLVRSILWALVVMKELSCVPIRRDTRIDAVPLSFVGECAVRLIAKQDRQHNCYHISSGAERAATWNDLHSILEGTYGKELSCCDPSEWEGRQAHLTPRERRLARLLSWYLPFINQNVVFSTERLRREFTAFAPAFRDYRSYLPAKLKAISLGDAVSESENP